MKLIADSGATKTHWVLIDGHSILKEIYTPGFNPYYYDTSEFEQSLVDQLSKEIPKDQLKNVFFYGSGVSSEENRQIVKRAIHHVFPNVEIGTYHDLHGAAIALLGRKSGIACILGTGSNSCLWDGNEVIANVPSVGYFLGDEGSGTYIGKLLVRDILVGEADPFITEMFYDSQKLTFSKTLDIIYKEPNPNKFLSIQAKFLRENIDKPYCQSVVQKAFNDFVKTQLSKYEGYKTLPVCFTGSIAANFQDILTSVLSDNGVEVGKIIKEPMEGMVEYHFEN